MEPLQDLVAGAGKLLDGVHDADFVHDAKVFDQRTVGVLVNAGLVAAKVNRHPIGYFVIEGLKDPLARGHGFLLWHRQFLFFELSDRGGILNREPALES
jgi:hypothetical protein